jgi:hypothetical protein
VRRRVGLMHQALEVYRHGGLQDIVAIARTQEDQVQMDEIRLQVVVMTRRAERIAGRARRRLLRPVPPTVLLGSASTVAAIAVLVLFYNLIWRGFSLRLRPSAPCSRATINWNPGGGAHRAAVGAVAPPDQRVGRGKGAPGARAARRDGRQPDGDRHGICPPSASS